MNVEWTQHARDLLDEQLSIILNARCPEDAARWYGRLLELIDPLESFPEAYPLSRVPALAREGVHSIAFKTYTIFYIIEGETCFIVSLRRAAMDVRSPKDL